MNRPSAVLTTLFAMALAAGMQDVAGATYEFRQQLGATRAKKPSGLRTPVEAPPTEGAPSSPVAPPPPVTNPDPGAPPVLPPAPAPAPPPVLLPPAPAPSSPTDGTGLIITLSAWPYLGEFTAWAGQPISIAVPPGAFQTNEAGAVLSYSARLANGQPLPAWLRFDPVTLTLYGTSPAGITQRVSIAVTARNTRGLSASSWLDLQLKAYSPYSP